MKKKRLKKDAKDVTLAVSDRMDARVGSVCLSIAGHDEGSTVVIVAGLDNNYVLVADGKTRKIISPKKKKMRHLNMISRLSDKDTEIIRANMANDSCLRKMIASFHPEKLIR